MVGLDTLGATPVHDELAAPAKVILMPHGAASTVFGDPMSGKPSGIARLEVTGGTFWVPGWDNTAANWDDSGGAAPTVVVYFADGTSKTFAGLQAINATGGTLRRGVVAKTPGFFTTLARIFRRRPAAEGMRGIGADQAPAPADSEDFGPLSPEQLSKLDRALSPAEQKAVDDWQSGQAQAAQRVEESKPFTDPRTGKKTFVKIASTSDKAKPGAAAPTRDIGLAAIIGGALVVVLGGALMIRRRR